jgi:hypothetical protein
MRKIWHPYWDWEDWKAGMWRKVSIDEERELMPIAVAFTGDADLYGSFMVRVTNEWPISCEHNLTDRSLNKQAWLGHAACALAKSLPEYIVRKAWGILSEQQRVDANIRAQRAIDNWILRYRKKGNGQQKSFKF